MSRYEREHRQMVFERNRGGGSWVAYACTCMWCVPVQRPLFNLMSDGSFETVMRWASTLPAKQAQEFGQLLGRR